MTDELNIQRLVSYITGNCSKKEQELVEQWLGMSDDNRMLFNDFKQAWASSAAVSQSCLIDIDKAWENFKKRANFVEPNPIITAEDNKQFNIKSILVSVARIAALVVVLFGLYLLFDKENKVEYNNYCATAIQPDSPFVLPDGSNVFMNKGAEIEYPEQFSSDVRNISFKGEAFFDVSHNPQKPMVIAVGNVRVKVLGTSFNLCNYIDSDEITVHLETGKVLFYSVDDIDGSILEQIILHPGQKGIYNKNTGLITKQQTCNHNYMAWKTGVLEFVNAPLTDVINVIESTYRINVDSEISLSSYHLSARFNNETPESIFESLQIIYGFNYEIVDNSVLIY